jgi:hypothetical protein
MGFRRDGAQAASNFQPSNPGPTPATARVKLAVMKAT